MPGKADIDLGIEGDLALAAQHQPVRFANAGERVRRLVGIGPVGLEACQPEDARVDGAVPHPGQRERALQFHRHPRDLVEPAGLFQRPNETPGDTHGADRVRRGRTDPDPEDVEYREHGARMGQPFRYVNRYPPPSEPSRKASTAPIAVAIPAQ